MGRVCISSEKKRIFRTSTGRLFYILLILLILPPSDFHLFFSLSRITVEESLLTTASSFKIIQGAELKVRYHKIQINLHVEFSLGNLLFSRPPRSGHAIGGTDNHMPAIFTLPRRTIVFKRSTKTPLACKQSRSLRYGDIIKFR